MRSDTNKPKVRASSGKYARKLREANRLRVQEQQMREAEERSRMLLDVTPLGVTLWDTESKLLDCNQAALRMFGLAERSDLIQYFFDFSPQFQPDGTASEVKAVACLRSALESGYEKIEWAHLTASGEPLPTEITMIRIPWEDSWRVAVYTRDLREAKAHVQKIRKTFEYAQALEVASRAAQIASQAKSEFLAKMSHELRTPLNAAIGFLGLELQRDLSRESSDNLEMSLDACYTLLHLINDILDISKIEAGRFELTKNDYHLAGFINEIVSLNSFRLLDNASKTGSKPLTFRLEVDENLPSKLHGDDLRIKQVLNNLLSNAFKYTAQGTVTLSIGLEPAEAEQAGSLPVRFSVRDTGKGIKAENLEILFTSYTRFDSEADRFIEGAGLGLAISKNLVEMMGGRMHVESEYGKGSVFACTIPQAVIDPTPLGRVTVENLTSFRDARRRQSDKYRTFRQSRHLPYARVLVVDDVQTNLRLAKGMLERYGMTVDCVAGGQQAVDLLRSGQTRYNAVFMDHMMPGMDGIQALQHIRAIDSDYARSVPVIIFTANVIAGNEKMFLEQGFQGFLSKPVDPLQLDALIEKWVDARQETRLDSPRRRSHALHCPSTDPGQMAASAITHAVEGLDMQEALWRYGSEAAFLDVLRSYAVNMPQLLDQMQRVFATDLAEYAIIAHGLKGASYGVGAGALGDMAKELEHAAKDSDRDKILRILPIFLKTAEKLLHDIGGLVHALTPETVAKENKPLKPAPDAGELTHLYKASLACSHSAMEKHLHNLEQYRYQSDEELVIWLRERVDAFDYALINERLTKYAS